MKKYLLIIINKIELIKQIMLFIFFFFINKNNDILYCNERFFSFFLFNNIIRYLISCISLLITRNKPPQFNMIQSILLIIYFFLFFFFFLLFLFFFLFIFLFFLFILLLFFFFFGFFVFKRNFWISNKSSIFSLAKMNVFNPL